LGASAVFVSLLIKPLSLTHRSWEYVCRCGVHYHFMWEALYIDANSHLNFWFKVRECSYGIRGSPFSIFKPRLARLFYCLNTLNSDYTLSI